MTKAVRIHANGGPEVLRFEEITLPPPAAGEARVRHTAIGINYSDINVRRGGFYIARPLQFPVILGNEAAGVVESVGPGVTGVRPGDRVAYAGMRGEFFEETGSYAQARNVPAERLLKLPDGVTDQQAAAMLVKGFTASLIINRVCRPKPGDTILIHTAAGGVGMILCQWSKHLGATVIGTVGSQEKAKIAQAHGCDHAILYREVDFVAAVKAIAKEGVVGGVRRRRQGYLHGVARLRAAVRDAGELRQCVGAPAADRSAAARQARLALGLPSRAEQHDRRCRRACARPRRSCSIWSSAAFSRSRSAALMRLQDAADAHRDIESRKVAGSVLLLP